MKKLYDFIVIPLLAAAALAYFALVLSGCGQRVTPTTPAGKIYSSSKY